MLSVFTIEIMFYVGLSPHIAFIEHKTHKMMVARERKEDKCDVES